MRKSPDFYIGCFIIVASVIFYSCGRTTGIDNNNVIQTPFSLFFSDTSGAVYNTNDGRTYNSFAYPPDGKPARALTICNNNVLMAKNLLYYSNNNGKNFNKSYDSISTFPSMSVTGRWVDLNQSMLVTVPSWDNRVYCMDSTPNSARNWLGLMYSDQSGNPKTWIMDGAYDTDGVGHVPVRMKSVTMLTNGTLCGLAYSGPVDGDHIHHRNFTKAGKDATVYANRWKEVTANPTGISYIYFGNTGGIPLPPNASTPDIGNFTLGHFNNQLIAIDQIGKCGAWYSDDMGKNWAKHTGLPANTPLLCIEAPFEEVCLIGTEGKGLYILNVHTGLWEPNNQGLGTAISVRNIAAKKNVYKNGVVKKFIYLATDQGIYESADAGRNWTRTIPGNFICVN